MKKVIVIASLLILASTHSISASEGDQLPKPTMEGQTISNQMASPTTDLSETLLPPSSDHQVNVIAKPQSDLSKEGLTSASQPLQPVITTGERASLKDPGTTSLPYVDRKDNDIESPRAVLDDISYQSLDMKFQGSKGIMTIFFTDSDKADKQSISAQQDSVKGTTPADPVAKSNQNPVAPTESEDLPHKDLSAAIKD